MNQSQKATKNLHKDIHIMFGWNVAIQEAEKKIRNHRMKIARLKAAIQTFKKQMEDGEPFPPMGAR